jgi:hypothetical protein
MFRYVAIAFFAFATTAHAQTVFVNSHIVANSSPQRIGFEISKDGTPPPFHEPPLSCVECDTEISFQYDGSKIKTFTVLADEASDWFLVEPGDIFSAATINTGKFPTIINLNPPPQGGEVTVGPRRILPGCSHQPRSHRESQCLWLGAPSSDGGRVNDGRKRHVLQQPRHHCRDYDRRAGAFDGAVHRNGNSFSDFVESSQRFG